MAHINKIRDRHLNNILVALRALCHRDIHQTTLPPTEQWPKTRDVAEHCEITIYIARYYLMQLVESNKVHVAPKSVDNSLRWYIAEPILFSTSSIHERKATHLHLENKSMS
ncbi:FaeA/PapI family transcriptional regulator [Chania multitudinisentens]|uniref:FaeA/PapI family transcriptional regulator n=1 Tax=Chania multitudinisentens TaxID=1639108 RepID=UPI000900719D|nr:FaeA/PapI family transcriptional regulator [Chania multitudinisentens]